MDNIYKDLGEAALDCAILYYLDKLDYLQQEIESARKELDKIYEVQDNL